MSSSRKCTGRLFQRRDPAAAKLLSPNELCVRGTAHDLSVDERSRRLGFSVLPLHHAATQLIHDELLEALTCAVRSAVDSKL